MNAKIIRPANREQWLEIRKSGIGSSEAATIMYLNPFETPYQLWRRKMGYDAPKEENFAMRAGHYLEDAVSKFYADATGATVIKRSAIDWIAQDRKKPYMQVSPDRTAWGKDQLHNEANKMIVECKTTQMPIDEDNVPRHWYIQLQYQLHVTGYDYGALAWLTQGREFGFRHFERNDTIGAMIEQSVTRFWEHNIIGGEEPELANAEDIDIKYPSQIDGKTVDVDEQTYNVWKALVTLKSEISKLDAEKKKLEDEIKLAFGDAEAIAYGGHRLATYRAPKATEAFDWKRFEKERPEAVIDYMVRKQGSRRLLIKQ